MLPGSLLFLLLTAWLLALPAGAASITASLDRATVAVGESAVLTLAFQGGEPKTLPSLPAIPNLQIGNGGASRSVNIINGQYSSTISQTYELTPLREGEFAIPAISAEVNGQVVTSQPLKLTATKGEQLAFMRLVVPKTEFYVGEVLTNELRIFVRDGVANAAGVLQGFDQFTGNPVKADGFTIIKTTHDRHRREPSANSIYSVGTLFTALCPLKTGPQIINSIEANLELQLPVTSFGFFQQFQSRKVVLSAEPVKVNILPLPTENVPADFRGAVGTFSILASAGPTNVAAGDPVTVKIQITGHGALESLALPEQAGWSDFKTYPPTSRLDTTDPLGIEGTKTFEQVVIPQNPDIKAIPAVSFSFFDPRQKAYRTVVHPPIPLLVRPAGSQAAPTIATARAREDNSPPTADIVHIKPRPGALAQISVPHIQRPSFLALQSLPFAALAAAALWRKRADALANNPRLRRQRQVARLVRAGLKELRDLAGANKSDEFFAAMFRLLQEQLGERLDLPSSAITEAVIDERLRPRGVPDPVLTRLQELFQACNQARYAPIRSSQELAAIIPRLESTLQDLQTLSI